MENTKIEKNVYFTNWHLTNSNINRNETINTNIIFE